MKKGDRVVIHRNPHDSEAEEIVGTVVEYQVGTGFMGCDLVYVEYEHPRDGAIHVLPFAGACLSPGNRAALLAAAKRYEALALELRALAEEASK